MFKKITYGVRNPRNPAADLRNLLPSEMREERLSPTSDLVVSCTFRADTIDEAMAELELRKVRLIAAGFQEETIKPVAGMASGTLQAFGVGISKTKPISQEELDADDALDWGTKAAK